MSEIKMAVKPQARFIVYAPSIASYLIKAYELTERKLILTTWVLAEDKIMDRVKLGNTTDPIRICTLDNEGKVTEEFVFENYKLTDWKVNSDWSEDKPLEIRFIYELN
jgi:hypothetical protein